MGLDLYQTQWFTLRPRLDAARAYVEKGCAALWLLDELRRLVDEADTAIQSFRQLNPKVASYELYRIRSNADYLAAKQLRWLRAEGSSLED